LFLRPNLSNSVMLYEEVGFIKDQSDIC
jgi:hypothetical protein